MSKLILCYLLGQHYFPFKGIDVTVNEFVTYKWCYRCKHIIGIDYKEEKNK